MTDRIRLRYHLARFCGHTRHRAALDAITRCRRPLNLRVPWEYTR